MTWPRKSEQIPFFLSLRRPWRPGHHDAAGTHDTAIAYSEGIGFFLGRWPGDYIPAAVPSGAAQEARYPAGTLGDIQAASRRAAVGGSESLPPSRTRDGAAAAPAGPPPGPVPRFALP